MIDPIDLQNFSNLMPMLYAPRSIEEFPEHVLSLLGKLTNIDELADNCVNFQEHQINRPPTRSSSQHSLVTPPSASTFALSPSSSDPVAETAVYNRSQGSTATISPPQGEKRLQPEIPIFSHYFHAAEGSAHKISDFSIKSNFHSVEGVYWRLLKPIGIEDPLGKIFADPLHPGTTHAIYFLQTDAICLTIGRSDRSLSDRDRVILDLIRPHLIQAYKNAINFTEIQQQLDRRDLVLNQSGTVLLSMDGQVELMTQRAWQLLERYFADCLPDCLPQALQPWLHDRLTAGDRHMSGLSDRHQLPMPVPFHLERSGQHLTIDLIPYPEQEQYLLKIKEHKSPFSIESLQMLGLTRREAEVLCSISKDKGNAEIAKLLNCSLGTVKKHLEHIYEKLAVQTRTAAIMKALTEVGIVSS